MEFCAYDRDRYRDGFGVFVETVYGPDSFLLDDDYVSWWFAQSPDREARLPTDITLAIHEDKVVGLNALIPSRIGAGDRQTKLSWLANTVVLPEYRRGLGARIVVESLKETPNAGSISYTPSAARILQYLDFELFELRRMARAVAVVDRDRFAEFVASSPVVDAVIRQVQERTAGEATRTASLSNDVLDAAEKLWERVSSRYGVSTVRSAEYLRWRYMSHPRQCYEVVGTWDSSAELSGVCVFRSDGVELKATRIVDIWGRASSIESLLAYVLAWTARNEGVFVDFCCTCSPDARSFESAGFAWLEPHHAAEVPFRLDPLEPGTYDEQLALRLPERFRSLPYHQFYITRGDGDRDRPP